jgi:hypothetical protein
MPRTSGQALAAAESILGAERLPAPVHLNAEQRADWAAITGQFPAQHFDGANSPLLEQLVVHVGHARQLSEQLRTLRYAKLTNTSAHAAKVRATFCELLAAHREESKAIASLCTKLRLSNSSHRNDRLDERKLTVLPTARPPWERPS